MREITDECDCLHCWISPRADILKRVRGIVRQAVPEQKTVSTIHVQLHAGRALFRRVKGALLVDPSNTLVAAFGQLAVQMPKGTIPPPPPRSRCP